MGPVHKKGYFFKTINIKVMKTIRNQVKHPKGLRLSYSITLLNIPKFHHVLIQFLLRLKRTTKRQQTKIQLQIVRKRCRSRNAINWP